MVAAILSEPAEATQPRNEQPESVIQTHRGVAEPAAGRVVRRPRRTYVSSRSSGDRHQRRAECRRQRFGIGAVVQILDTMVDSGDLARAVAAGGLLIVSSGRPISR